MRLFIIKKREGYSTFFVKKVINKITLLFLMVMALSSVFTTMAAMNVHQTKVPINIDGIANEISWQQVKWHHLTELMAGTQPTANDFSGRFKILWDQNQLYILAEIVDDKLFDQHSDPLELYWDDDCLEIFIDENASGGNHQFNYNAFAYHIGLDNQAVDIGINNKDGSPNFVLLNDHIKSVWRHTRNKKLLNTNILTGQLSGDYIDQQVTKIVWEVAVRVYDDTFVYNSISEQNKNTFINPRNNPKNSYTSQPVILSLGKTIGFMLAYCDNDGSKIRESFIGSTPIKAVNGDKNLGYITADVFDKIKLIK